MTGGRVLIVRAEPAASRTAARVAAIGFEPVVMPVSEMRVDQSGLAAVEAGKWSAVALTSANAVRALASRPGLVARLSALPCHAVGERTAALAREAGFAEVTAGSGDGGALASLIADRFRGGGSQPLVYCAGLPRSGTFENGLKAAGVPFEALVCYRTEALDVPPDVLRRVISPDGFAAILLYSREQARMFFRLVETGGVTGELAARSILCLSKAAAEGVPEGFQDVVAIAEEATENSLIAMLSVAGR